VQVARIRVPGEQGSGIICLIGRSFSLGLVSVRNS
jgi:hypothetical protein